MMYLLSLLFVFTQVAVAQTAPTPKLTDYYDAKVTSEIIAQLANGKKRAPASPYSKTSEDVAEINAAILSAKTADDLDLRLNELEKKYATYTDDAKFFAAHLLTLKPLRGIAWRLRSLFEQKADKEGVFDWFSGNRATHSAAVSMLRSLFHITQVYVPTDQGSAIFAYLVTPSKSQKIESKFKNVAQLQKFLREYYDTLDTAAKRLKTLAGNRSTPYVYDSKVLYGKGTFDDDIIRFVAVTDIEVALAQAALQGAMHGILVFNAYNQNQLMNVLGKLGKLYGVDGFNGGALGVMSKERRDTLWAFRGRDFLRLLKTPQDKEYGRNTMKSALEHLQIHAAFLKAAYDMLEATPENENTILNPIFFKPKVQPRLNAGVNTMHDLVNGRKPVRSPITGESVTINIPQFYNNPPEFMLDLLPLTFQPSSGKDPSVINAVGEKLIYRDYSEGRPLTWGPEWNKIFELKENQSVADAFRVIEYSNGPGTVFGPMSYFIF